MSAHEAICRTYGDETLAWIVRQLTASGDWPARCRAAKAELERRKRHRRNTNKE